jgi:hypothetical protein
MYENSFILASIDIKKLFVILPILLVFYRYLATIYGIHEFYKIIFRHFISHIRCLLRRDFRNKSLNHET